MVIRRSIVCHDDSEGFVEIHLFTVVTFIIVTFHNLRGNRSLDGFGQSPSSSKIVSDSLPENKDRAR